MKHMILSGALALSMAAAPLAAQDGPQMSEELVVQSVSSQGIIAGLGVGATTIILIGVTALALGSSVSGGSKVIPCKTLLSAC